ncbi:Eco57I restriction-modification methylase domain-containing protein [Aeromicrobium duanguangcaii]|uniref:Eco57I restriction-modification methylase domain-containing protein n=1 Tax=Aeromicrobium duanguangcaii TaxID=2968086 RepID=UPI002016EA57|nr:Eco57I restriction-modification methylase domain-containing protein [Aeromicrobium duanguangcaii]
MTETLQNHGEVFTRLWVVETMLDLSGYTPDRPLHALRAIEPSVGSGAFWVPMVERLLSSLDGDTAPDISGALRGYDLLPPHIETCKKETVRLLTAAGYCITEAQEIADEWLRVADFLLDDDDTSADFVIGNPPYIRSDELDQNAEIRYRELWPTMTGRADIYVGFYERGLRLLSPNGRLAYICADRWMRNAYGARLRAFVSSDFAVEVVWQMHDVNAFEAEVSAYPAITVIRNADQEKAVVAECHEAFDSLSAAALTAFTLGGDDTLHASSFAAHRMTGWFEGTDLWPAGDPDRIALLEDLNERFPTLEETGVKVGIGVATGADKAYIVDKDFDVEPDRKLPMVMTDDMRFGPFVWGGKVLLNPWGEDGQLIDLDAHPKLKAAYESHPKLKDRYVAKKQPAAWFKTIDKVDPTLTPKPKLLLQDMKARITPVYEAGGFYPHHNLYYMVSDTWDLKVLGGLMLSSIAQAFIEAYGVKMRGGTLRFQAQYLRKIRVPHPNEIDPTIAKELAAAFDAGDRDEASRLSAIAYGI